MVEKRRLGIVGMNHCQYFMSLAILLGPNLKTSDNETASGLPCHY